MICFSAPESLTHPTQEAVKEQLSLSITVGTDLSKLASMYSHKFVNGWELEGKPGSKVSIKTRRDGGIHK